MQASVQELCAQPWQQRSERLRKECGDLDAVVEQLVVVGAAEAETAPLGWACSPECPRDLAAALIVLRSACGSDRRSRETFAARLCGLACLELLAAPTSAQQPSKRRRKEAPTAPAESCRRAAAALVCAAGVLPADGEGVSGVAPLIVDLVVTALLAEPQPAFPVLPTEPLRRAVFRLAAGLCVCTPTPDAAASIWELARTALADAAAFKRPLLLAPRHAAALAGALMSVCPDSPGLFEAAAAAAAADINPADRSALLREAVTVGLRDDQLAPADLSARRDAAWSALRAGGLAKSSPSAACDAAAVLLPFGQVDGPTVGFCHASAAAGLSAGGDAARRACHLLRRLARGSGPDGQRWQSFFRLWEALDDHALHLVRAAWQSEEHQVLSALADDAEPGPGIAMSFVPWGQAVFEKALRHGNAGVRKLAAATLLDEVPASDALLQRFPFAFASGALLRACCDARLYSRGDKLPPRGDKLPARDGGEVDSACGQTPEELMPLRVERFYCALIAAQGCTADRQELVHSIIHAVGEKSCGAVGTAAFLRVLAGCPSSDEEDLLRESSARDFASFIEGRVYGCFPPWIEVRLSAASFLALLNLSRRCAASLRGASGGSADLLPGTFLALAVLLGRGGSSGGAVTGQLDNSGPAGPRGSVLWDVCWAEVQSGLREHVSGAGLVELCRRRIADTLLDHSEGLPAAGNAAEIAAAVACLNAPEQVELMHPVTDWASGIHLRAYASDAVVTRAVFVIQELLLIGLRSATDALAGVVGDLLTLTVRRLAPAPHPPPPVDRLRQTDLFCGLLLSLSRAFPEAATSVQRQLWESATHAMRDPADSYFEAAALRDRLRVLRTICLVNMQPGAGVRLGAVCSSLEPVASAVAGVGACRLPGSGCPPELAEAVSWPIRLSQLERYRWEVAAAAAANLAPTSPAHTGLLDAAVAAIPHTSPGNLALVCDVARLSCLSAADGGAAGEAALPGRLEVAVRCFQAAVKRAVRREVRRCYAAAAGALLHPRAVAACPMLAEAFVTDALHRGARETVVAALCLDDRWAQTDSAVIEDSVFSCLLDVEAPESADGTELATDILVPVLDASVFGELSARVPTASRPHLSWRATCLASIRRLSSGATPHPRLSSWLARLVRVLRDGADERTMPNTPPQRRAVRAWQCIGLLIDGLTPAVAAEVTADVLRCLDVTAMQSTRRVAEAVCGRLARSFPATSVPVLCDMLWDVAGRAQTVSSTAVVATHLLHHSDAPEALQLLPALLPLCTSNHFVLRLASQMALHGMLADVEGRSRAISVLGEAVADSFSRFLTSQPDCVKWRERYGPDLLFGPDASQPVPLLCSLRREGDAWLDDAIPRPLLERADSASALSAQRDLNAVVSSVSAYDRWRVADIARTVATGGFLGTEQPAVVGTVGSLGAEEHCGAEQTGPRGGPVQAKITPWKESAFVDDVADTSAREASAARRKQDVVLVASLVSNPINVAALARAAEVFGAQQMPISSRKAVFGDRKTLPVAMSAEQWLDMPEVPEGAELQDFLSARRRAGYTVIGIEQTTDSVKLDAYQFPEKCVVVLGRERTGVPPEVMAQLDVCVEITQLGLVRSLNVHVCGAIVLHEITRQRLAALRGEQSSHS